METHCDNPCLKRFWETWKNHKKFQWKNSKGKENDLLKDLQRSLSIHCMVEKTKQRKKKKAKQNEKRLRSVSSTSELPSLKVLEWVLKLPKKDRTRTREKSWYWQIETIWKVKKQLYKDDNYWGKLSSDVGMDR